VAPEASPAEEPPDARQLVAEARLMLGRLRRLGEDAEADRLEAEIAEVERQLGRLEQARQRALGATRRSKPGRGPAS
jgi:hypothetical protein